MTSRCPNCQAEIEDELVGEDYCHHCGQEFVPAYVSAAENDGQTHEMEVSS